jgi:hypothetical protein
MDTATAEVLPASAPGLRDPNQQQSVEELIANASKGAARTAEAVLTPKFDPEVMRVQWQMRDAPIASAIRSRASEALDASRSALDAAYGTMTKYQKETTEFKQIRGATDATLRIIAENRDAIEQIKRNPNLSPKGREIEIGRRNDADNKALHQQSQTVKGATDRVRAAAQRVGGQRVETPASVVDERRELWNTVDKQPRRYLLIGADEALQAGRDTNPANANRAFRANLLLRDFYKKALEQMADDPPRSAEHLAGTAAHLAETIESHLQVVFGDADRAALEQFADTLDSEFRQIWSKLTNPHFLPKVDGPLNAPTIYGMFQ